MRKNRWNNRKIGKNLHKHFMKDNILMANWNMKWWSISLDIMERQNKLEWDTTIHLPVWLKWKRQYQLLMTMLSNCNLQTLLVKSVNWYNHSNNYMSSSDLQPIFMCLLPKQKTAARRLSLNSLRNNLMVPCLTQQLYMCSLKFGGR